MTKRARRKPPPVPCEIRVRLDAGFLAGRPDAAAVVARVVETLRQGLPYARVDLAPPPPPRLAGYAACLLLGAGLALAVAAAVQRETIPVVTPAPAPQPTAMEATPAKPAEPVSAKPTDPVPQPEGPAPAKPVDAASVAAPQTYTLGIPLPPTARAADEHPEVLARQLAVCTGLSMTLQGQRPISADLAAALEDASRTLERSTARQVERARTPAVVVGRWREEGAREARGHIDRKDLRGALRRLAECRAAVGREIALPS